MRVPQTAAWGGRPFATAVTVLVLGLLGLMAPAAASAVTYTVNETGDGADANVGAEGCDTVAGGASQCSLRAAIQESNNSTGFADEIFFDGNVFKGDSSSKILISGAFPDLDEKVRIAGDVNGSKTGGRCEPLTGILGPCVQIERASLEPGLVVDEADEVEITGLSIVGMSTAITVSEASSFIARDDWIGVALAGTASANTRGILLAPASNQARIGGATATQRNVIAGNTNEGVDIEGASNNDVLGNYFGLLPGGVSQSKNGKDLEVTDSNAFPGFEAVGNIIGTTVGQGGAETAACDEGCNVFASGPAGMGIDLEGSSGQGELPASGPTTIAGNYVGLNAKGESLLQIPNWGIYVGGAGDVTVGGGGVGAGNNVHGSEIGIYGEKATDLVVEGNLIGLDVTGTETLTPPGSQGIYDSSLEVPAAESAEIVGNRISMSNGESIRQQGTGALIRENVIGRGPGGEQLSGGNVGIRVWADNELESSTVADNVVENSEGLGILVENEGNVLTGNTVGGAGSYGILLAGFAPTPPFTASKNIVGGDIDSEENKISDNGEAAIAVLETNDTGNQIKRNTGAGNGIFIDLNGDGLGNEATGPHEGIQAPTIGKATATEASGSGAEPGATIRVFRKESQENGEIASFLGEAAADGGGAWSVSYAAIPGGASVGVTQSDGTKGTSEMAVATTPPTPVTPPPTGGTGDTGNPKGKGKGKGKAKGTKDKTPPQTTITKGPKRTHKRTVKFKFVSSEAGSTFKCKLDRKPTKPCASPKKYSRLKPGKHVFKVFAIDRAGNKDPTPATRKFRVTS